MKPIPPAELESLVRECYEKNPCETRQNHLLAMGKWYISRLPNDPAIKGKSWTALHRALGLLPEQPEQGGKGHVTTIEAGGKEPVLTITDKLAKWKDPETKAETPRQRRLRFWSHGTYHQGR